MTGTTHQTKTWSEEILTVADLNNHVTDPIEGLANPPRGYWAGATQTPATNDTWEVVNVNGNSGGGEMSITITPDRDGWIYASFIAECDTIYDLSYSVYFDLDGTRYYGYQVNGNGNVAFSHTMHCTRIFRSLTENQTYTFKLQIKETGDVAMKDIVFKQFAVWTVI